MQYDFLGQPRYYETEQLFEFMGKLEEVEQEQHVPNSSISFYTHDDNWRSSKLVPYHVLEELYNEYGLFHESMEDFESRMEFDNGTEWVHKFLI